MNTASVNFLLKQNVFNIRAVNLKFSICSYPSKFYKLYYICMPWKTMEEI